jgi:hypothetical protein
MNKPTMGEIRVKLVEKADLNDLAIIADGHSESQLHHFRQLGDLSVLKNALLHLTLAVELKDERDQEKPCCLLNLGDTQVMCFKYLSNQSDLENVISNMEEVVQLMSDGSPSKTASLTNLALTHKTRFEHFSHLANLEKTISSQE